MPLEVSGERMMVDHYQSSIEDYVIYLEHLAAYRFAARRVADRRVLDYGCGSGYGAAQLAEVAAEVVAVDVSGDAIEYASSRFRRDNLRFLRVDPTGRLPFRDAEFAAVLSFQVFEHIADAAAYLREIARVLEPGGELVLVTPDRTHRLLPLQKPWNRWHVREYDARSLSRIVGGVFAEVSIQQMSGRRDVLDVELRRFRRLKWLTLPATLPCMPDRLRVALLNGLHRLRAGGGHQGAPRQFDFGPEVISIGPGLEPSLNLVAIAKNPHSSS